MSGTASAHPNSDAMRAQLTRIDETVTETALLLRQIAELLMPKADPDKPRIEDLIAALVAQQSTMLTLLRQIAGNVSDVLDRLPPGNGSMSNGHSGHVRQ